MATEVPGGLLSAPPPPPLGSLRVGLQLPRLEGEVLIVNFYKVMCCEFIKGFLCRITRFYSKSYSNGEHVGGYTGELRFCSVFKIF